MPGYDVIVAGAGHAGVEAALAAARMGKHVLLIATHPGTTALMACNPSVGGTSKGHLVREVDAMGGEMGLAADECALQVRMLNTGKGPAVHSLRAQVDKHAYQTRMSRALDAEENITRLTDECIRIIVKNGRVCGVECRRTGVQEAPAAVIAAGTYLNGRVLIGRQAQAMGPSGFAAATELSGSLAELGFSLRRFKTGTPPRVDRASLNLSATVPQPGDDPAPPFSFLNAPRSFDQQQCYLTYTSEDTHKIIREHLHESAMYSGLVRATGARYCPSIEDKVVRFADKERHQIFLEPEGLNSREIYVQGMSTSLPCGVQQRMLHSVPGMERVRMLRPGYAIEYDCIDPTALSLGLGARHIPGLYLAGQINGSSGYEEAAAQGWLAGVNAALYLDGKTPFHLTRSEAYLGVLADDLTIKGTDEPYRMMTSRAEYRLLLRQDNADLRLTEKARRTGLISDVRYNRLMRKREQMERLRAALDAPAAPSAALINFFAARGEALPGHGVRPYDLLRRQGVSYTNLLALLPHLPDIDPAAAEQVEITARYEGYIKKQEEQLTRARALEDLALPPDMDYAALRSLRLEARQKLAAKRPENLGRAARIPGVSPADVAVLIVALKAREAGPC